MKKPLLLILALILPITTGFVINRYTKNMLIRYSSQDLPEQGLIIVKPSDPEFNDLAATLLTEQEIPDFEKIKPFSIFLKNNSTKAVVGHSIVWQFKDSTGKKTDRTINYLNSPALTDGYLDVATDEELNESIPAGGYKFLTLIPNVYSEGEREGGAGGGGSTVVDKNDVLIEESDLTIKQKRNKKIDSLYSNELGNENDILISLSGVFFEDGLFVGSDTTNFFSIVDAHVRAKRDLDSYISSSLKKTSLLASLDRNLKEKTEIKLESPNLSNPEDQYSYTTKTFATYYLKLSQLSGKEGLTAEINKLKNRSLPKIRKL